MKVKDLLSTFRPSHHNAKIKFINEDGTTVCNIRLDSSGINEYNEKEVKFWYPYQDIEFFGADLCVCI